MASIFDKVRQENTIKKPPSVGYIWTTILIKYDYKKGIAEVVRSFSKPAKQSSIKNISKPKAIHNYKNVIDFHNLDYDDNIVNNEEQLF